jgi:hypothetical protein
MGNRAGGAAAGGAALRVDSWRIDVHSPDRSAAVIKMGA